MSYINIYYIPLRATFKEVVIIGVCIENFFQGAVTRKPQFAVFFQARWYHWKKNGQELMIFLSTRSQVTAAFALRDVKKDCLFLKTNTA